MILPEQSCEQKPPLAERALHVPASCDLGCHSMSMAGAVMSSRLLPRDFNLIQLVMTLMRSCATRESFRGRLAKYSSKD